MTTAAVAVLDASVLSTASAAGAAVAEDIHIAADTDVYLRDYVGDAGVEPHSHSVWTSPDIKGVPNIGGILGLSVAASATSACWPAGRS